MHWMHDLNWLSSDLIRVSNNNNFFLYSYIYSQICHIKNTKSKSTLAVISSARLEKNLRFFSVQNGKQHSRPWKCCKHRTGTQLSFTAPAGSEICGFIHMCLIMSYISRSVVFCFFFPSYWLNSHPICFRSVIVLSSVWIQAVSLILSFVYCFFFLKIVSWIIHVNFFDQRFDLANPVYVQLRLCFGKVGIYRCWSLFSTELIGNLQLNKKTVGKYKDGILYWAGVTLEDTHLICWTEATEALH